MALATKCPHCNTVFRVAHDQLKLRGGIVRCGSCNEVFDGNAALLEPPSAVPIAALAPLSTPLPDTIPLDQKMAALDTRAAQMLAVEEAEPVLEFDSQADAPAEDIAPEPEPDPEFEPEPAIAAAIPLPATLTPNTDALFDLDLDIESEPDLEASIDPEVAPVAAADVALADVESLSEAELEAALEAELEAMEQTLADVPHEASDSYAGMSGGRIEPTWDDDDAPLDDEPQAGAGPGLSSAFAAADAAIFAAEAEQHDSSAAAPPADSSIDDDLASFLNDPAEDDDIETVEPLPPRPLRDDELDDVDEAALVELSSGALAEAQAARAHAYLRAQEPEPEPDQPEEPGFVKRDRQRQKYGKAATISMSVGSLLLLAALFGQAVTTFRNTLAASTPALKPLLAAACQPLGCKIELPTQIDDLTIEQGELQTLSDTTFSFATLLRNQSATAQGWPSIELMLDDDKDKHVLRRVFSPRDYLPPDVAADKGFAPRTEQAVKLYFELHDVKASGYHIAVFYP